MSGLGEAGQMFLLPEEWIWGFVHSQQPTEGARTQEPDNREAPENPLCPAKVHHVGKPFAAKLVEKGDSFLPPLRPGEKLNTGGARTQRMWQLLCKALHSPVLTNAGLRSSVLCKLLVPYPVPKEFTPHQRHRCLQKPSLCRNFNFSPF